MNLLKSLSVQLGPSKVWESPRDLPAARRGFCASAAKGIRRSRVGDMLTRDEAIRFVEEETISWGHERYPSLDLREESWVVLWIARNQQDLSHPMGTKNQLRWLRLGQPTGSCSSTAKPGMLSGGGVLVFGGLKGKDESVIITSVTHWEIVYPLVLDNDLQH